MGVCARLSGLADVIFSEFRGFWPSTGKHAVTHFLTRIRNSVRIQRSRKRSRPTQSASPGAVSESLESRQLLSAVVGTVYEDLNSDGIKNPGENGLPGWTVYLDLDNSGTLNTQADGTPEPSAKTNVDGDYIIRRVLPGTYRVTEILKVGWTPTVPISRDVTVIGTADSTADFFNFGGGKIFGTVWNDLNADGIRAVSGSTGAFLDPGLADWTVFLDLNTNGAIDSGEPTTLTDSSGGYSFLNVPAGDYEVTEVQPEGWDVPPTFDIKQTATVKALKTVVQDFANFSLVNGSIQGTVWNDLNADGIRQTDPSTGAFTEPGIADWTVFLDLNNNRVLDGAEVFTQTDASGHYGFASLLSGDYEVTELLPEGWEISPTFDTRQTVTVQAGKNSRAADFANFTVLNGSIRGTIWNDLNRDGVRNKNLAGDFTDPGLNNWTVCLDLNHNGVVDASEPKTHTDINGMYTFPNLQVGDYDIIEVVPSGWETAPTFGNNQTVAVLSGTESVARDFANFDLAVATPGSISGFVWNDLNGNGLRDTVPSTEPGLAGRKVFLDLNTNGIRDASEPQTTTGADGSYTISGVQPGTVTIVDVVSAGWHATAPLTSKRSLTLRNGENAAGCNFGNQQLTDSAIRGTVFADTNKNALKDSNERGLGGILVYLDLNNNALPDSGEPQTLSSDDLYYTPNINEAGSYNFTHLAAGTYIVRQVIPDVLSATPAEQFRHTITITAAQNHSGLDFADAFRPNEIHGIKFGDTNDNHVQDSGETGIEGTTIFIDLNRNNFPDDGEPTTITLADGSYSFTDLTPGAYVVREVETSGFALTYPTTTGAFCGRMESVIRRRAMSVRSV